ncbi:SPOR domain-containing protein [Novosphingobium bradum]|uniref:SPOR domain-containing protein n=1 Tax=Novosphingobium bradum TaxID=1737444 RepID=A0ABV7IQH1_9SPHN
MASTPYHATLHREPLYRNRQSGVRLPLAVGSALAFSLLAGCTGQGAIRSASAATADRQFSAEAARGERAVAKAEAAVARTPDDAAVRAELGRAYLAAGRFESAGTALGDAMALGDGSGRTALSYALARIGGGQLREAVAVLDEHRGDIPAGDLGLALALAGETSRGVAILADAVRGGENTPKLRQNLAYAYALDGRWAEAKVLAAQDVPADQLDRRLAIWAISALPDRNRDRVAGLIGAPVRMDPGQPEALALHTGAAAPRTADAAPAGELPAVAPVLADAAPAAPVPSSVATNLAAQSAPSPAPAVAVHHAPTMASVAQAFTARDFQANRFRPAPVTAPARTRAVAAIMARPLTGANHVVQLGAFGSEKNARRAWAIYTRQNPKLAAYRPVIVPAVVKGRQLWRVAAGGLSGRFAANGLCAEVRSRGGACFAYALPSRPLPLPAAPGRDVSAPQRARR